ncbi:hypothetical protein ABZP36_014399 [Zizania latifolia]
MPRSGKSGGPSLAPRLAGGTAGLAPVPRRLSWPRLRHPRLRQTIRAGRGSSDSTRALGAPARPPRGTPTPRLRAAFRPRLRAAPRPCPGARCSGDMPSPPAPVAPSAPRSAHLGASARGSSAPARTSARRPTRASARRAGHATHACALGVSARPSRPRSAPCGARALRAPSAAPALPTPPAAAQRLPGGGARLVEMVGTG